MDEPRTVTEEDREYASELLADLANGGEPRLDVAAQWFRKARVENSLRWDATSREKERPCATCGGSGFSGRGTGYDDVCGECGGLQYFPLATP